MDPIDLCVKEARIFSYDNGRIEEYCRNNPFYQTGIITVPATPELITRLFHHWRSHGPKEVRERFKKLTDPFLEQTRVFVPVKYNDTEEWMEIVHGTA